MNTPSKNSIALESHLRALEDLSNLSKQDTTQIDPDQVLYHLELIRENIPTRNVTINANIELAEFANHIAADGESAYSKYRVVPGESPLEKATFIYSLLNDFQNRKAEPLEYERS
jgi:hypothetical protein